MTLLKRLTASIVLMTYFPLLVSAQQASLVWCENNAHQDNYILLSHLPNKQGTGITTDPLSEPNIKEFWTEPVRIHTSENTLSTPSYTQNESQHMLVWSEIINKKPALMYSYSNDGENWNLPKLLTKSGENLGSTLIKSRDNTIWVFWSSDRNGLDDIFSSRWNGASWSSSKTIHPTNDVPDVLPRASLDQNGDIVVTWQQYSTQASQYVDKTNAIKQDSLNLSTQVNANKHDTLLHDLTQIPFDISQSRAYIHVPRNPYQQSYTSYQQ